MKKIITILLIILAINIVYAQSTEPVIMYDLTDITTDNFQGDVIVLSGIDKYSWGYEMGYLSSRGFADKNKKVMGVMGVKFIPVKEDGSYCQTHHNCTWEEHTVIIDTDLGAYTVNIPAGDSYKTQLYFYIADDGSTYWAKSNNEEGPNYIDLSFEDAAVEAHLAVAAKAPVEEQSKTELDIEQEDKAVVISPQQTEELKVSDGLAADSRDNLIYTALVIGVCIMFIIYFIRHHQKNTLEKKPTQISKRRKPKK